MRIVATLVFAVILLVTMSGVSYGITNGQPDANRHPYVGLIAFFNSAGQFLQRCSGALLSPTKVLTAGHCTAGATLARVW
ncbi:MAG: trypsin-like serine protease, partial [bacterium]